MRAMRIRLLPIMLLIVPLTDLGAQESRKIEPGSRLRVRFTSGGLGNAYVSGTLLSIDANALVLRSDWGDQPTIPLGSITRLEVSQGLVRSSMTRIVVFAGIGGSAGLLARKSVIVGIGETLGMFLPPDVPRLAGFVAGVAVIGAVGLWVFFTDTPRFFREGARITVVEPAKDKRFLAGAASGALVGVVPQERWEEVPLALQVGMSPHGDVRVALRYNFGR